MVDQLEQIIGQPHAVKQLKSLTNNNRIPHALLFTGPPGVGKFFTALQFVKSLNPESMHKKIENFEEPLLKLIMPLPRGKGEVSESSGTDKLSDKQLENLKEELHKKKLNPFYRLQIEGANIVKISSIREVRKFLSLEYTDVKNRVVIIDEAHLMNTEAQNALLKSLEEPPDGVIFILITPYEERLLPTINSRCWQIKFSSMSTEIIKNILIDKFQFDASESEKAAVFSSGSVHKAVELIENEMSSLLESTIQILRFSLGGWFNSAYIELKKATDEFNRQKVKDILTLIQNWLVDVQKNKIDFKSYYFSEFTETLDRFNNNFPDAEINSIHAKIDELLQSMDKNILLNVILLNLILHLNSIAIRK